MIYIRELSLKTIILLLWLCCISTAGEIRHYITFGPRISISYGNSWDVNFGFETSYWTYKHWEYGFGRGVSVNFGVDYYLKSRVDIYSELQTGLGFAGISLGGFKTVYGDNPGWGLQSTVWGLYFVGGDYRFKYGNEAEHQIGIIGRGLVQVN